jgi:hypothetical protein
MIFDSLLCHYYIIHATWEIVLRSSNHSALAVSGASIVRTILAVSSKVPAFNICFFCYRVVTRARIASQFVSCSQLRLRELFLLRLSSALYEVRLIDLPLPVICMSADGQVESIQYYGHV